MSDFAAQMHVAVGQAMKLWVRDYPNAWVVLHAIGSRSYIGDGGKLLEPWYEAVKATPDWLRYFDDRLRDCARLNFQEEAIVTAIRNERLTLMRRLHQHYAEQANTLLGQTEARCLTANLVFPEEAMKCDVPMVKWRD